LSQYWDGRASLYYCPQNLNPNLTLNLFCVKIHLLLPTDIPVGNSVDKLRHPRSDAYSAEQIVLNTGVEVHAH